MAHWDGVDNTLANGVRSHDANATVWCDLSGNGNDVPLTNDYLSVEANAVYSDVIKTWAQSPDASSAIESSKTAMRPALTSLNGLTSTGNGGTAYTIELVLQRADSWFYDKNEYNLQNVFETPRGTIGFRRKAINGLYCWFPEVVVVNNQNLYRDYLMNWTPAATDVTTVNTYAATLYPNKNRLYLGGATQSLPSRDNWTAAVSTNFTFFGNTRVAVRVHAIRVYNRALAPEEVARNAIVDRVRFAGGAVPLELKPIPAQTLTAGTPCTPEPVVVNPLTGETLVKGTDYMVAYADNARIGRATLTVTGIGAWAGQSAVGEFAIDSGAYHFVDFIASSGTQIIDTEIIPSPTMRMEAEIAFMGSCDRSYGGATFFGCTEGMTSDEFGANFGGSGGQERTVYAWLDKTYAALGGSGGRNMVITDTMGARMQLGVDCASGAFLLGRTGVSALRTTSSARTRSLHIFGSIGSDGIRRPFSYYTLRVYGWKIWNGGTLVRDFVPCRRAYDGEPGLLDRVSGRFFGNLGTSSFSSGSSFVVEDVGYEPLSYLQASGTQWIDVDYLPNPRTRVLMDYSMQGTCNRSRGGGANPFGCTEPDGVANFTLNYGANSGQEGQFYTWFDKSYGNGGNVKTLNNLIGHALRTRLEVIAGSGGVTNGSVGTIGQAKTTTHTRHSLAVFGIHVADGTFKPHGYYDMRLFGFKIWEGDALVRDLVPSLRLSDDKPGLLDRVSGRFFVNGATLGSDFTYARAKTRPTLPAAYQVLDGLIATGVQHVATGVTANNDTFVSLHMANYNLQAGRRLFSSRGSIAFDALTSSQLGYELYLGTGSKWACACGDGTSGRITTSKVPTSSWDTFVTLDSATGALYADGNRLATATGSRTTTSPGEIDLFSGGGDESGAYGALRNAFIFKDGQMVRNLVPCVRTADGMTGLYDLVSENFLPSSGDRPFFSGFGADRGCVRFTGSFALAWLQLERNFSNLSNFTLSAWVKDPDLGLTGQDYAGIVSMGALNNAVPGFCCFVSNESNNKSIVLQARTANNKTTSLRIPIASFRRGRWHHLVCSYSTAEGWARFYLDGKVAASVEDPASVVNPAIAGQDSRCLLTFGNRSSAPMFPYRGALAHVSVWDYAMNANEVQFVCAQELTGEEGGLLGYWPFDGGMDGLRDHVANGNARHSITSFAYAYDSFFVVDPIAWKRPGSILLIR